MFESLRKKFANDPYFSAVQPADFPDAVTAALTAPLSDEERRVIDRIEAMRRSVEANKQTITFMDYGAGSKGSSRTKEEMVAGVPTTVVIGDVCAKASKPRVWAEALFRLVRYGCPEKCLELGTCLGISASYISAALHLNGRGELLTLEGAPTLADEARKNINSLGFGNTEVRPGRFADTLQDALEAMKPVGFMFIDGHHDRDATMEYFLMAKPYLAEKNILVFDDITWSEGMKEVWREIQSMTNGHTFGAVGVSINVR